MDEVFTAEVLHSSGNIGHELDQHLRREVLQDRDKVHLHVCHGAHSFSAQQRALVFIFAEVLTGFPETNRLLLWEHLSSALLSLFF